MGKRFLLFFIISILLMSCNKKPDISYKNACADSNALKAIKYYVKHNLASPEGLLIAAEKNTNEKIIKELLKSKYNTTKNNDYALLESVKNPNPQICKLLINAGADVDTKDYEGNTPLQLICKDDNPDKRIIENLIESKADINAKNKYGMTPWICVVQSGNLELFDMFINAKADINIRDDYGKTIMMIACESDNIDIFNALLKAKADINARDNEGETALMIACKKNNLDIVNALLEAKAEIDVQNSSGKSALIIACDEGKIDVIDTLLRAGANVNIQENNGYTPLGVVYFQGFANSDIINILIKAGADINIKSTTGKTPLMIECSSGNVDMVNTLIVANIDVNAQDSEGETALMIACKKGYLDIVNILLKSGADIKIKNKDDVTAYVYAFEAEPQNKDIMAVLEEAGADIKEIYEYNGINMVSIPGTNFEMMSTEVTQKLYKGIMGTNPSYYKGDNLPVDKVGWYDAVLFCNALSNKMGLNPVYKVNSKKVTYNRAANGFRLPTLEEWEYSAKGGENYKYSGSNNVNEVAWHGDNSGLKPHPVAQKKPNGYGLYDMSGNVWEWCWDAESGWGIWDQGWWITVPFLSRGGAWDEGYGFCEIPRGIMSHANGGFRIVREIK